MDMTTTATGISMSMSMTSSVMPMSTSSMGGMDHSMHMGGHGGSSDIQMTSAEMAMVFFTSVTTPLFSLGWTPAGTGSYAGTCIFLIVLAALHRILVALGRVYFEAPRATVAPVAAVSHREHQGDGKLDSSSTEEEAVTARVPARRKLARAMRDNPFHVGTETARACFEVVSGGVSYLLMLAVMTMNVGYFMSVLGGIFLGVLCVGRISGVEGCH